ncbi:outer membrane protein assembly factor BamA [uncultured Draconibacterium sp.]|uniref:outer membrane protein assembly factor BamA n=1 Tax=uncultured Draconibacterium sp. TaxID=1573823 RepID=UPI0029C8D910|nr:outer membrane protein assembly factor BamA [uncultured Draconibacterium sp.]
MIKKIAYIFFFSTILQLLGLSLKAQENYEIRKISFKGNRSLESSYLLDKMVVDEVSYLEKLLTDNEPSLFSRELLDLDLERLKKTYQSEGFVKAQIMLDSLKVNEEKQTVKLNFIIDEGDPYTIDTVIFQLNKANPQINIDSIATRNIRKLSLRHSQRFSDESLKGDIAAIRNIFLSMSYAYVDVDYEIQLDTTLQLVGITYVINPGPVSHFGATTIKGNDHVDEEFIRKQFNYREGEDYNKSLLDKTRESLYHLQLFSVVSVLPQKDKTTLRDPIPVNLYVEEAPRLNTEFGAGYGTEDKFRAFVDLTYLGFLGTARRVNIYAKHSAIEPYYVSVKWTQPQVFDKKGSVSIHPFLGINKEPGYQTRTYGLNLPVTYRFNKELDATLTYYYEKVKQQIEEGDPEFPDPEDENYRYNKSGVLLSSVFSTARPKFSPDQGVNLSMGMKLNGYKFGGDFSYLRVWGDFRTYQKIDDLVLALRGMIGGIHSSDDSGFIPVEDRFYSGGSNSIRGWSRSDLGPKRESGTPLGGKSILEANAELRYPLFWRLSGVAFFEGGNVWEKAFSYKINELAYAAGGGLRVDTPIGPVRFDVGLPLWNEKKSPQFFISVGQAF